MIPEWWPLALHDPVLAAVAAAALVTALLLLCSRLRRLLRAARSRRLGARAEAAAEAVLKQAGYRLLQRQCHRHCHVLVNNEPVAFEVRADALVRQGRRQFVAEIKGGRIAADIRCRDTRRQLREYAAVFDVDGVVLVDMVRKQVHEVRFPD